MPSISTRMSSSRPSRLDDHVDYQGLAASLAVTVAPLSWLRFPRTHPQAVNPCSKPRGAIPAWPVTRGDPGDGPKADRVSWPIVSIPDMGDGVSWRSADSSPQSRAPRWVAGSPGVLAVGHPLSGDHRPPWVARGRYAAKRSPFADGERASPGVWNLPFFRTNTSRRLT